MQLNEIALRLQKKAGLVPYIFNGQEYEYLCMVSSNPTFGGPDPMLSKGSVDPGESFEEAPIREAEEELGLIKSNMVRSTFTSIWDDILRGYTQSYQFKYFAVEVKDKTSFTKPHFETKHTLWMTLDDFKQRGRDIHLPILQRLDLILNATPATRSKTRKHGYK